MAVSSVDSAATSTTLASAAERTGLIVTNTDANRLYVVLDSAAASTSNFSFYLDNGDSFGVSGYEGEVRGIWAANGSGAAKVTQW